MKIARETKIGIIIIAAIAIAIFGINYLKGSSLITNHRKFFAIYDRVDGLKATNPVVINGLKVGQVSRVQLMGNTRILVTLSIDDNNLKVTRGSVAKIVSADILGSKAVEFFPGPSSVELETGDTLMTAIEMGLKEVISETVDPLKAKFVQLMSSVDSVLGTVNQILDEKAVNDLNQGIGAIRGALLSLEQTAFKLDQLLSAQSGNISATLENTRTLTGRLASSSAHMDRIMVNLSNVTDTLARANIGATLLKAKSTMESVDKIMSEIDQGKGSLGMLLKSDSLHNELVAATNSLDKLFIDIQSNPKRYLSISVFGKSDKIKLTNEEQERLKVFINSVKP